MTDPQPPGPTRRPTGSGRTAERDLADAPVADGSVHLTTLTYEGRFWDAFVEFVDDSARPEVHRARLCFVPADGAGRTTARTAAIIVEPSTEAVLDHARSLARHQIVAMLRSATCDGDDLQPADPASGR